MLCNKAWDKNARKRFILSTNIAFIKILKRNTIQCSNVNVSWFVQLIFAKTNIVYFGIILNFYLSTLCFGLVSLNKILPTYPYLIDLGRGRNKKYLSFA